jgi:hypothetical protein
MEALVNVETICSRYGVERHEAGRIIRKLPSCFKVGRRMYAYERDLSAWERDQMETPVFRETKIREFKIPRRAAQ